MNNTQESTMQSEHMHDANNPAEENKPNTTPLEGEVISAETETSSDNGNESVEKNSQTAKNNDRASQAEEDANNYKDQWLRAIADFKNYKRRAESEREELKKQAAAGLLLKFLPILDDFERAVESAPEDVLDLAWWKGTRMILQKFYTLLESEGIAAIDSLGQPFDPNLHHAVTYEDSDGQEEQIVAELQKGYMLHDRVLRPAMVKVGKV